MSLLVVGVLVAHGALNAAQAAQPVALERVQIEDDFWGPKLNTWRTVTIPDCFDKFEKTGAFVNFDRVRDKQTGEHQGPPWYDGLVYEMIRASGDFMAVQPDPSMLARIDAYIERIAAASDADPEGYINTFTQLMEPDHRWGTNGGYERICHDLYNAGALVEAATHYYRATGKTRLLRSAVRMANLMYRTMGPPPKKNLVPSHSLGEEALIDLYQLFREKPDLKNALDVPVNESDYLSLAQFWLEARGHHCGQPDWEHLSEAECSKFIRESKYSGDRPSWGSYAQDHKPVLEQQTIEGHAVRATLMCAGLSAAARATGRNDYAQAAQRLWDNMTERKMHITGGVGAFANDEKFGPDYVLPNDAYLETCAAVGAGFFHWNMYRLYGEAKYVDELERVLYNGALSGVSLQGNSYYYENPLVATNRQRWDWHGCPCCPPMFLKLMGALPGYIYSADDTGVYVNLFVGSRVEVRIQDMPLIIHQRTVYPWNGKSALEFTAVAPVDCEVRVRVPGWSEGTHCSVNDRPINNLKIDNGFARIRGTWQTGDRITIEVPLPVRQVFANPRVEANVGRAAIMRGPVVYCVESADNAVPVKELVLSAGRELHQEYRGDLLGGVAVLSGKAIRYRESPELYRTTPFKGDAVDFTAIPFYANSNRTAGDMVVWLPVAED
ncbi:MAG: glycoside hydrolase family 127 protein [Candidatus Hydrogenedentes bacterium]|nr:glycoside hydrolase family 127 protein [Candidatus Hydrogenedentota bacterium]